MFGEIAYQSEVSCDWTDLADSSTCLKVGGSHPPFWATTDLEILFYVRTVSFCKQRRQRVFWQYVTRLFNPIPQFCSL